MYGKRKRIGFSRTEAKFNWFNFRRKLTNAKCNKCGYKPRPRNVNAVATFRSKVLPGLKRRQKYINSTYKGPGQHKPSRYSSKFRKGNKE